MRPGNPVLQHVLLLSSLGNPPPNAVEGGILGASELPAACAEERGGRGNFSRSLWSLWSLWQPFLVPWSSTSPTYREWVADDPSRRPRIAGASARARQWLSPVGTALWRRSEGSNCELGAWVTMTPGLPPLPPPNPTAPSAPNGGVDRWTMRQIVTALLAFPSDHGPAGPWWRL